MAGCEPEHAGHQAHSCGINLKTKRGTFILFLIPLPEKTSEVGVVWCFVLAETYITVNAHQHASSICACIVVNAVRKRLQFHAQGRNKCLRRLNERLLILFFMGFKPCTLVVRSQA